MYLGDQNHSQQPRAGLDVAIVLVASSTLNQLGLGESMRVRAYLDEAGEAQSSQAANIASFCG